MPDHQFMYQKMFEMVTYAIRKFEEAVEILKMAQVECEEIYISSEDEEE